MMDYERFRGESPIEELTNSLNETLRQAEELLGDDPEYIKAKIAVECLKIAKMSGIEDLHITEILKQLSELTRSIIYALPTVNNYEELDPSEIDRYYE